MQYSLSFIIPARNEMFLKNTVEDILAHKQGDTEIIVGLDGQWADPPLSQHPDVNVIFWPKSIGQRAITNRCASLSKAKYLCKLDAHCSIASGFDVDMLAAMERAGDNTTMVSIMRNLHAFDWWCGKCGWKKYQGPTPERCPQCGERHHLRRKIRWIAKHNPQSTSYCFDATPHFGYFEDYKHRPQYIRDKAETGLTETMSLQGSCFMLTREKYWELDICDEKLGNWGNQGVETACKTWLSGGRVLVNHNTFYGHCFRTSGGDFGFPYSLSGRDVQKTKENVKKLFWNRQWPKQIHPVSWLVEKFWPVTGWNEKDLEQLKIEEAQRCLVT